MTTDKPTVEGLMELVDDHAINALRLGDYEIRATYLGGSKWKVADLRERRSESRCRVLAYAERLAAPSQAAQAGDALAVPQPLPELYLSEHTIGRTAGRTVVAELDTALIVGVLAPGVQAEDRELMEQALEALTRLVARIEANGGIGEYVTGPAFVMQEACDAIAALRTRLRAATPEVPK